MTNIKLYCVQNRILKYFTVSFLISTGRIENRNYITVIRIVTMKENCLSVKLFKSCICVQKVTFFTRVWKILLARMRYNIYYYHPIILWNDDQSTCDIPTNPVTASQQLWLTFLISTELILFDLLIATFTFTALINNMELNKLMLIPAPPSNNFKNFVSVYQLKWTKY